MLKISTYIDRREKLVSYLSSSQALLVPAAKHYPRNWDSEYYFDQDADFYYLTGFNEPEAMLLLLPGHAETPTILFCRANNEQEELWIGKRAGLGGAVINYQVDIAYDIHRLEEILPELLVGRDEIYYPIGKDADLDQLLVNFVTQSRKGLRRGGQMVEALCESRTLIRQMRAVKSSEELAMMRRAMELSGAAHIALMQSCRPEMFEYELEALFAYKCRSMGADALMAYDSIVATGANACTLHYHNNDEQLRDGDLLLVDAGCRYDHYTSDITRTYPVNGKFTDKQKQLYEVVLQAQLAVIAAVRPGVTLNDLQNIAIEHLTTGLVALQILHGAVNKLIADLAYKKFYPHLIGHWLGLDTHDPSQVKNGNEWVRLVPGMILTVEPGLYIQPGTEAVDAVWYGMGIRIEDDILVTEDGHEVLTKSVPKTVAEIEKIMAS
jgi:Xaa-Pro aminopeptidase